MPCPDLVRVAMPGEFWLKKLSELLGLGEGVLRIVIDADLEQAIVDVGRPAPASKKENG